MSNAIILGVAIWWTFAVVSITAWAQMLREGSPRDFAKVCMLSVFWPLTVIFASIIAVYRIPVASAKTLRADLRNRKLLREFERWVHDRKDASND